MHVLRFTLADTPYAIPIERIAEVVLRVLITPLAGAPSFVDGVFSFRRSACVAISMRRRLGHPARPPRLDEHLLVVRGRHRLLGLVVDRAEGDEILPDSLVEPLEHGGREVSGVVARADGVVLIHDIDALLSDAEEITLDASLAGEAS